tara:strand:+ start:2545 stop:3195 length:651 start_codon:yes stop_codon:yes gene_type:complete
MSFIPKVKMDFVPDDSDEEPETIIPEVKSERKEIIHDEIFEEDIKKVKKVKKKEVVEKVEIIEESEEEPIIEEPIKEKPIKEKRPRKKKEYTDEQREAMRVRMAKVRASRKIKGTTKSEDETMPIHEPIQEPQPMPIIPIQAPPQIQKAINPFDNQETIEKMIFAGIQSYDALRKERKAQKQITQQKVKEQEDFKNSVRRAMNRKPTINTNPFSIF